jgi:hypothetical protein
MYEYSLFPYITKPTRIGNNSSTLIDNIFSNHISEHPIFKGLLYTDISDHLPTFMINNFKHDSSQHQYIKTRNISEANIEYFKSKLDNTDWSYIMNNNDVDAAFGRFHTVMSQLFNECFPIKTLKMGYKTRHSWLSFGLKKINKEKKYFVLPYEKASHKGKYNAL